MIIQVNIKGFYCQTQLYQLEKKYKWKPWIRDNIQTTGSIVRNFSSRNESSANAFVQLKALVATRNYIRILRSSPQKPKKCPSVCHGRSLSLRSSLQPHTDPLHCAQYWLYLSFAPQTLRTIQGLFSSLPHLRRLSLTLGFSWWRNIKQYQLSGHPQG